MPEDRREAPREDDRDRWLTVLRAIVHQEVKDRTSSWPTKNGDGFFGYLGRWITPERILLVVVLIYNVGGRVAQFQTDIKGVTERETALAARVEELKAHLNALTNQQTDAKTTLEKQDATLADVQAKQRALDEQVRLTVTRREFREAVEQRILPRLDRIEKR